MERLTPTQAIEKIKAGESLAGLDLSGFDFSNQELCWADFFRADLTWAKLTKANLYKANLAQANLRWTELVCANMVEGNLREAYLHEANCRGANLSKADLYAAELCSAKLVKAVLQGADLSKANLTCANLSLADLSGANLSGTNLSCADLSMADLSRIDFAGANLTCANLSGANLCMSQFPAADLTGANLTGAKICGIWFAPSTKLDKVVCAWYDLSPNGDGSDVRHPGKDGFKDIIYVLESQITVHSQIKLSPELFAGLYGLSKALQVLEARVKKVEDTPSGGCAITFEAVKEENLIPAVLVSFNALVQNGKINVDALYREMGDLNKIIVNQKPLIDLLKATPYLIDTSQLHYGMLEKFRKGFLSLQADIRGESISIRRNGTKLFFDYYSPIVRPQNHFDYSNGNEPTEQNTDPGITKIATSVGIAKIFKHLIAGSN